MVENVAHGDDATLRWHRFADQRGLCRFVNDDIDKEGATPFRMSAPPGRSRLDHTVSGNPS
jgi:hypothetical protein